MVRINTGATLAFSAALVFLTVAAIMLSISLLFNSSSPSPSPSGELVTTAQARVMVVGGRATRDSAISAPGSVLTEHEISHMRYMREEEKLARDVYLVFVRDWNLPVFSTIVQAEQRHMDAVLILLQRYGIPDPVNNAEPGQFLDTNLSSLFTELTARGSVSIIEALKVGGLIEEVDIADLQYAIGGTSRNNIIRVYKNIHRGSRNHLRAFAGMLAQYGVSYQPQKLSPSSLSDFSIRCAVILPGSHALAF